MIPKRAQNVHWALLAYLSELQSLRKLRATSPWEANRWCRQRSRMKLVEENGRWRIEGVGKELARIAYRKATDL